jgi:tyrocidine synthetase-3
MDNTSLWIEAGKMDREKRYWLNKMSGDIVKSSFSLGLREPGNRNNPPQYEENQFIFANNISAELIKLSTGSDIRLMIVLSTLITILLSRHTGNRDIIIGVPVPNAHHRDSEMCHNVMPIRNQLNPQMTFREFLQQVRQTIIEADDHRNYPLEVLAQQLKRSKSNKEFTFFDVGLILESLQESESLNPYQPGTLFSFSRKGNRIKGTIKYQTNHCNEHHIERLWSHLQQLTTSVISNPYLQLGNIELLMAKERNKVLLEFNQTHRAYSRGKTLDSIFNENLLRHPHLIGITGKPEFGELNIAGEKIQFTRSCMYQLVSQLAGQLKEEGIGKDNIVGIKLTRSIEMVMGIFGILKTGAAYLPIEPTLPENRIQYLLADIGAATMLTAESINIGIAEGAAANTQEIGKMAYVIYTSGSTGLPKAVQVAHASVVNLLYYMEEEYPLKRGESYLMKTSFSFDVSVSELFGWIMGEGRLVISERGDERSLNKLLRAILYNKITHINFVPSMFQALLEILDMEPVKIRNLSGLKYIFLAGEAVSSEIVRRFRTYKTEIVLENLYGPTEATVYATRFSFREWKETQPVVIGKPISNVTIYILDENQHLQPIGVAGEICIAGEGLAQGYLNQPELTSQRFVTESEKEKSSLSPKKIYRTGDLARWLPDGNVEFLGRRDRQVKIRGYRIEPGEIENQLLKQKEVKEAVVIGRRNKKKEKFLCAYILPLKEELKGNKKNRGAYGNDTHSELASIITKRLIQLLPGYMVPQQIVIMEEMPLTPAGKIDVRGLPDPPIQDESKQRDIPENEIEMVLSKIWKEVLGLQVSPVRDDHFFNLGGHSLKATSMVSHIYKEFEFTVEIEDIFNYPLLREMSQYLAGLERIKYASVQPYEKREYYDLSYAQRRLWVLSQFEEDSTAYNMPAAVVLKGELDVDVLQQSLQDLVDRHESLRTLFNMVEGEPKQRVIPTHTIKFGKVCILDLETEIKNKKIRELYREFANQAFDLERGPLFHFLIITSRKNEYIFAFNIHHIINDGWSQGIIQNEIITRYNDLKQGKKTSFDLLQIQYKDYSAWHNKLIRSGRFEKSGTYWLEKLQDKPNGVQLPLDHPRKAVQTFNGQRFLLEIPEEKQDHLKKLGAAEGATLFMVLLTLIKLFLYKYTSQRDMIIGAPIANRKRQEFTQLVGFLVNTLVYRVQIDPNDTFRELCQKVKREALQNYRYQDYPFDLLVEKLELERDLSQSPLFNVMIAHNNAETEDLNLEMEGVKISGYPHIDDFNMSKFDLIFFIDEKGTQLQIRIEFNSDLFKISTIQRMAQNFIVLTDTIIQQPEKKISELEVISQEEKQQLIYLFNQTQQTYPLSTLCQLLEDQVGKSPNTVSVVGNGLRKGQAGDTITYRELNKRINQVAHYLHCDIQLQANDVIGISLERSIQMIIVLVGIIKSGAAYLAVDPTYPADRIHHILTNSKARMLMVDENSFQLYKNYRRPIVCIKEEKQIIDTHPDVNPGLINQPSDILYVNYTSGSTGTPNGAMLSHHCLNNLIRWQLERSGIQCSLRCVQFTSINFCVSFQEILGSLTGAGQLHLIGEEERQEIDYFMNYLGARKIEVLFLPFSYLNFLFNESGKWHHSFRNRLKHIITAGEQLKMTIGMREFLEKNSHIKLHNHYGSTEMHVVTSFTLNASEAGHHPVPPAGKPISNINIYILDENQNPVPIGVWGEIYVKGNQEILGYIHNTELTQKKLIHHPEFSKEDHIRIYRTGDVGRWKEDGNIELGGRTDNMVKIRGFRVELGEIESKLLAIKGVKECVVIDKKDEKSQKYLVGYLVLERITLEEVHKRLSQELPQYMIPRFIFMEKLPLMPNGKVDRQKLPEPENLQEVHFSAPGNRVERQLVEMWNELLKIEKESIGIDNNFFEMGGHSLKATLMVSRIHKEFDVKIALTEVFKYPFIRGLAKIITGKEKEQHLRINPIETREYYSLSSPQKRMYILQQIDKNSTLYNMPCYMELREDVSFEKLDSAFHKLIQQHESLRTCFQDVEGKPVQIIRKTIPFKIEKHNQIDDLDRFIKAFIRSFDLTQAPILRVGYCVCGEKKILVVDIHHIISDGESIEIITSDFIKAYSGNPLHRLRIQYKDFNGWQENMKKSGLIRSQEEFWLEQFKGEIPVLELPIDYPRPDMRRTEGRVLDFEIGKEETRALNALFYREGQVTMFMILLSIYTVLLSKLTSQEDVIVGIPTSGREHIDLQPVIGVFVNTLPLRHQPLGKKNFREFTLEVKNVILEAFQNQNFQFDDLVEGLKLQRHTNRNPIFDVMCVWQNHEINEDIILGVKQKPIEINTGTSKFDLTLAGYEIEETLKLTFEYNTRLFEETTISRIVNYFRKILSSVINNPGQKIKDIEIISEEEKFRIIKVFNNTFSHYPKEKTMTKLFKEQVKQTPDYVSIVSKIPSEIDQKEETSEEKAIYITYQQLDQESHQLSQILREKGVRRETLVGIMMERSIQMIAGVLGILKSGAGYLPIAPEYPDKRKALVLKESQVLTVLSSNSLTVKESTFNQNSPAIDFIKLFPLKNQRITPIKKGSEVEKNKPDDLAYVIYTSGSTGNPKGVMVTHRNVVRLIKNPNYINFDKGDSILPTGALEFDASTFEIWGALLNGLSLCLVHKDELLNLKLIRETIRKLKVTMMWMTSGLFSQVTEAEIKTFKGIKKLLAGGDVLSVKNVRQVKKLYPQIQFINGYGPTENTTFSTTFLVDKVKKEQIPIGTPISNSTVYIVNPYGKLQPVGIQGELWVGGDGVSRGYLNNPELTAEKFIQDPFRMGDRIYKTGDLTKWNFDGDIEFLGRKDDQIKIRGYRLELGEVQLKIATYPAINEVVVVVIKKNHQDSGFMTAYFTSHQKVQIPELRQYLDSQLPGYMIPQYLIQLDKFLLTHHGKIDRSGLPDPEQLEKGDKTRQKQELPFTETEKKVSEIWKEILKKEAIGIHEKFFEIGGNSLNMIQVHTRIQEYIEDEIPVTAFFRYTTIQTLSQYLNQQKKRESMERKKRIETVRKGKSQIEQRYQKRRTSRTRLNMNKTK